MRRWMILLAAAALSQASCAAPIRQPAWVPQLGYRPSEIFALRTGHLGMPFVEVEIGDSRHWLLLDTGDMAGLTMATPLLDQLQLPETGRWNSYDADGRVIGTYRRFRAPAVRILGHTFADETILELDDTSIAGLVGPAHVPGTRFTLDYGAGIVAVASDRVRHVPAGAVTLPMTRSSLHPHLVLTLGKVNGRSALIELDTGASRTNVDPSLVRELGLPSVEHGVRIRSVELGPFAFDIPSARVNPKAGIDSTLSPPIQLAVGSDVLHQLVLTVDYALGEIVLGARASSPAARP